MENKAKDNYKKEVEELKKEIKKLKKEEKKLNEDQIKLKEEVCNLNEKLLRSNAELQNYRKRRDDEVEKLLKYSEEDIIVSVLPIIDNFERAIKLDDENLEDELSKFLSGFKMIYSSLVNMLNSYEVKEIDSYHKEFDTKYHQAVITDKIEDKEDNIIIEVLQKGYMYKDKVIRPSMVKVNKK